MESLSFSMIIITVFSIILFLVYSINKKSARKGTNRNAPQAKDAWPLIGHLHLLGGHELPHKVLSDMAEKYGPIFTIKLGSHQALVVNNAELARECLTKNDKAFAGRPKAKAFELMGYNYAMFGFYTYGEYWRQMRKLVVVEFLSRRRVEMLSRLRVSALREAVKNICDDINESGSSNMVKVDMSHCFGQLTLNTMVRMMSGNRYSSKDEEGIRFHAVIKKWFILVGAFTVSDFIPYLKFLDVGGYQKQMKKIGEEVDQVIDGWLKERRKKTDSTAQHDKADGDQVFLDVLINIIEGASKTQFPYDHDTVIKATVLNLLAAGVDTTATTLTWALSLLLNNPSALETARAEIDKHVGRERLVEESDMKNLIYLEAIIKETFRMFPAIPLSVPHESIEDCVVGGYNIPKGTRLLLNISKIHRDPNTWSNPSEFKPERFLTSLHQNIDVNGQNFDLIPFSSGRRMCPGDTFALHVVRITLATLIQLFDLKRPSNHLIDMTESQGISNSKRMPLEVLVSPRLSPHIYDVGL